MLIGNIVKNVFSSFPMVKNKISKTEAKEKIEKFFSEIKNKSPKEVLKIKKLAMSKRISLKKYKTLFCSSCLEPYPGSEKIRIKGGFKTIKCPNCGKIKRIKI